MLPFPTLPVSQRIQSLRDELFAAKTELCVERASIVTRSYKKTEDEPWVVRRALALAAIFDEMPIFIRPGELIVGQRAATLAGRSVYPEYNLGVAPGEELPDDVVAYWNGRTIADESYASFPEIVPLVEAELAAASCTGSKTGYGHVIVDYEKALTIGFRGIAREARARMAATPTNDHGRLGFYRATIIAAEGIIRWAARYADVAEHTAAETTDAVRRQELEQIAGTCRRVPAEPARTFCEALQSFWFTHLALHLEQFGWSISAGRFDQYMFPYFESDLAGGRVTDDSAWELLLSLWIKFMENVGSTVGETIFQNLTLGGQDEDGKDQSNELSSLCVDATVALKVNQPALSVRWHPNINPEFWEKSLRAIGQGLGMPALFNDEVVMAALTSHGVPRTEALGYGIVGCVEASVPGRQQGVTAGGHLNAAKALELALNEGRSMITDKQIGAPTAAPETFQGFDDLWLAYEQQVKHLSSIDILASQLAGAVQKQRGHCPLMSSLLDDCLETGKDLVDGGTRFKLPGVAVFGTTNVCDAMIAIRSAVCENGTVGWGELRRVLLSDYADQETLRLTFANSENRFGNDVAAVDRMANRINALHAELFWSHTDTRGGRFTCGVWPVEGHVQSGHLTAATPDGRHSGTTLVDGVGACHGADRNGPTALLSSAARLDYAKHWPAGSTCNIKFSAGFVHSPGGVEILNSLVTTFMKSGGQQLQINVVDAATLKEAQERPELHHDLIVRVAGFSAYFTMLDSDVQDEIIARTEQRVAGTAT